MDTILGIKFRDYGQIYFFTLPEDCVPSGEDAMSPVQPVLSVGADMLAEFPELAELAELGEVPEMAGMPSMPDMAADTAGTRGDSGQPSSAVIALWQDAAPDIAAPVPRVRPGELVIAETGQGPGLGMVVHTGQLPAGEPAEGLGPIIRLTTPADQPAIEENRTLTLQAMRFCTGRIRARGLDMKLVDVEVLFDKSKFIFYFTAPTRIDFRELVKDLVREYHVRIELRQIGVRHETQMIGAVGNCGMVCCCRRFLRKFAPVTIKMAKEQNLFLNPSKISGICGRLLCCLSYEQENYEAFHRECPRLGKRYQTDKGDMKVLRANLFRCSVIVLSETNEELEFSLDDWRELNPRRPDNGLAPRVELRPADGRLADVRSDDGRSDDGRSGDVRRADTRRTAPANDFSSAGAGVDNKAFDQDSDLFDASSPDSTPPEPRDSNPRQRR